MASLRFYFDWVTHFLAANSRHGTHSPFIYQLVDKVVYAKRRASEPPDKVKRLIVRLIDWFQPGTVYDAQGSKLPPTSGLDFVIVDCVGPEKLTAQMELLWPQLHAGSVLVVSGLYRDAEAKALWQSIKIKREVTVTIDLFRVGLVFFHLGQAKEDFKIRY